MQNITANQIVSYLSSKGNLTIGLVVKTRQNPTHQHLQDVRIVKVDEQVSLVDIQRLRDLNIHELPKADMYKLLGSLNYQAVRRSLNKENITVR